MEHGIKMIYEYKCAHCNHEFERELPMASRYLPSQGPCPNCLNVGWVCKLVSKSNFKIKGMCAANGYSNDVGDIEKHLGRPYVCEED